MSANTVNTPSAGKLRAVGRSASAIGPVLDAHDLVLGVDVGGTTIKAEITDAEGAVLAAGTVETPRGEAAFEAMLTLGDQLLARLSDDERDRVRRAAVLLPGVVDADKGIAVFSANVGWRDVEVGPRFTDRWSMPVLIEHDVAAAGWAEWRFGGGRGRDTVCVIIIGTGISGTLSVAGKLVRGATGQAGEYGHIALRRTHGIPCPCGNVGCVETVASAPAITRAYARRTGRECGSAAEIFDRLSTDDDAQVVVDDAVAALADGLLGVVHAVCPEAIVLGGGLAGAGDALAERLHDALTDRLRVIPAPEVVIGDFGARAGLVGAALYARHGALT
ncbi:ROK family protein [Nocardia huaxiensis]|uniref:ROK family protein n=1 Tax=Nocardia huaxiensis TaxID=2755382 RepID=A0A7D6VB53_9NOCA|nr:ROK family protein [Nocardia huaxiensis]QLY32192.1 ROK family protein [Nocardia huaxiensis]UFS94107.1 ROK family protein [Nocardia huaxiensis]